MASAKIEDRKSFLGGPWDVVKGGNPVLTKGLFKPPMDPLVSKYDDDISAYRDFLEKKKDLQGMFDDMGDVLGKYNDAVDKINDDLKKVVDEDFADMNKNRALLAQYSKATDPDPKDVVNALSKVSADFDESGNVGKTLFEKKTSLFTSTGAQYKKIAADYKTKSEAIANGIKKLEDEMNKLDDQIRKLVQTYEQLAIKIDKDDLVKDLRGFLGKLP